jgi:hypothetical protein
MKTKYEYVFIMLTLSLCFVGCFGDVLRDTASLKYSADEDITVVTKDSSRYYFEGGSYTISQDTTSKQAIYGQAKKYRPNKERHTNFQGSIPLSDVEKIYSFETTPFFYVCLGVVTVSVVLFVWFAPAFSHFGTGG